MSPVANCWDGVASLTREEEGGGGWLMLLTLILGPRKQNRRRPRCALSLILFPVLCVRMVGVRRDQLLGGWDWEQQHMVLVELEHVPDDGGLIRPALPPSSNTPPG